MFRNVGNVDFSVYREVAFAVTAVTACSRVEPCF